jgi:hypothetical protein
MMSGESVIPRQCGPRPPGTRARPDVGQQVAQRLVPYPRAVGLGVAAASALREAGAHVAGRLVLARRVNLDRYEQAGQFWTRQAKGPFDRRRWPVLASAPLA